jgi:small subunit ribosomal protein S6
MKTRQYEAMFLLDNAAAVADFDGTAAIVDQILTRNGATIVQKEKWDERKLAYEIDKKADGSYHLLHFTVAPETLDEISRVLKIDDTVMRHLATRRPEGGPSEPLSVGAPASHDEAIDDLAAEEEKWLPTSTASSWSET